jgi:rubredoxin
MNTEQKISVCAWCRHEYDAETGERIRRLTDAEYAQVITHGCCPACGQAMLAEYAAVRTTTQEVI